MEANETGLSMAAVLSGERGAGSLLDRPGASLLSLAVDVARLLPFYLRWAATIGSKNTL
jgi:hypothetical protein